MLNNKEISQNLRFLVIEVKKQHEDALRNLSDSRRHTSIHKSRSRDNYIDTLRSIIQQKSHEQIAITEENEKHTIIVTMALSTITNNLEKIADYAVNIIKQNDYINHREIIKHFDIDKYYKKIFGGLEQIVDSLMDTDANLALEICDIEPQFNDYFKKDHRILMTELKKGSHVEDYVTMLNIIAFLEKTGDALLNIGEAILSTISGIKIRISQFLTLNKTLQVENPDLFKVERIANETRSGCNIGRVRSPDDKAAPLTIFKTGKVDKILEEKQKLEKWHEIIPGITPRVLGYETSQDTASLLAEYIDGTVLQEIILGHNAQQLMPALNCLQNTLQIVWSETKIPKPTTAHFTPQIYKRIEDVFKTHPHFNFQDSVVGNTSRESFDMMLARLEKIEADMACPFSVFIHGDFNNDNIIYDHQNNRTYFVDLHRSKYGDYAQDLSVFIVSNFRTPVFEKRLRQRLQMAIVSMYNFAKEYSVQQQDKSFDARLTVGLIRSLITSTRYELREHFAKEMFYRAIYLIKLLVENEKNGNWDHFQLPSSVLDY